MLMVLLPVVSANARTVDVRFPRGAHGSTVGGSITGDQSIRQGEASAKFSVRPQDLTTNMAFKSGNNYVVQGYFDGANGTTFFSCYFDLDGHFQSVT